MNEERFIDVSTLIEDDARQHLQRLMASWGILADFCFSDLILYFPLPVAAGEEQRFHVLSQVRPTTAQTIYLHDLTARTMTGEQRPIIARAYREGRRVEGEVDSLWLGEHLRVVAIPVRLKGNVIAVVARESGLSMRRQPGELERTYLRVFDRFARMIEQGEFPFADEEVPPGGGPRVGDGVVVLDAEGRITFTSPNATSALHRAGVTDRVRGRTLAELNVERDASYRAFFLAQPTVEESDLADITLLLRCIPLLAEGRVDGAVVLLRDITELRSRDRLLVSKDATIREIHHRVKNNLQTISSLLRLQGRRLTEPSAKAAIEESVRRIAAIALVHETLSHQAVEGDDVNFAEIVKPLLRMVEDGLVGDDTPIRIRSEGDPGRIPSVAATSLSVVLTELLQNVMDHAYPDGTLPAGERGAVTVRMGNDGRHLRIEVVDDGVGLPEGFVFDDPNRRSLGLSIVRSLIGGELNGTLTMERGEGAGSRPGTRTVLELPMQPVAIPNANRPPRGGGRSTVGL